MLQFGALTALKGYPIIGQFLRVFKKCNLCYAIRQLGFKIKQLRSEQGLSQADLGIEIDVEKSNISRLESGRVNPRTYTLYKVATALKITLSDLLNMD